MAIHARYLSQYLNKYRKSLGLQYLITWTILLAILVSLQPYCLAETARIITGESSSQLDELTSQALQKEIQLLKLNTYFRLETTDHSRFKPWRVFFYNLAGAGASNAGITVITAERWRTWQRPARASRNTLKAGPMLLMIGHSIVLGGILIEAALDTISYYKSKKRSLDIETTKRRAMTLQQEIDGILAKRQKCINSNETPDQLKQVSQIEGKILEDIRDLALLEYAQFHVRAKKRRVARWVSCVNGISSTVTGGYMGSLLSLIAIADRKPRLVGPAGIGFTISGSNIATGPILSKVCADITGKRCLRKLRQELALTHQNASSALEADCKELKILTDTSMVNQTPFSASIVTRANIYHGIEDIFKKQAAMNVAEKKKADKEFKERLFFNACVGGTKMAWGIQLANAGFGYHRPAPAQRVAVRIGSSTIQASLPRPHNANEIFARQVARGATTYLTGTSLWILDTIQARTRGELDVYTMGAQNALPHQKLQDRLNKLEEAEDLLQVKAIQPQ